MEPNEDIQLKQLVNSGLSFIRQITERYGVAEGAQIWENIMTHVDDEAKGAIMFAMLTGQTGSEIKLSKVPPDQLINAIRAVRIATGLGLKEAKDLVDGVMGRNGPAAPTTLKIESDIKRETLKRDLSLIGAIYD